MTIQSVSPSDKLKFRYIAAYLAEGLQAQVGGPRVYYSNEARGKKVYLTSRTDEIWNHIDTAQTISYVILTSLFHGKQWDPTEFTNHRSARAQKRLQQYGDNSAFLVLEASHEEEASRIGTIAESEERDFCLALPNGFRDEVETRHKTFLEQAQSFLYFAMPSVSGLQSAASCIVANHPNGKPLYVLTGSMSVRPTLSAPIPTDPADGPQLLTSLFEHSDELENFQPTFRLFAGSAANVRDNLRAFLFAFTALESFLSKFFKSHKQHLLQHRKNALSAKVLNYIEEIEQRRKDQGRTEDDYPIPYKFALIASYFGFDDLDDTVDDFDDVTRDRNAIAHGYDFDEARLPTAKVWTLLGGIIRLYMRLKTQEGEKN